MPSQKQIDANRRNAQKSTGPVTEAGKAVAKFNALRHGMTAESAVLPYEDHLAYAMLREALLSHYAPGNIAEEMLVDVVANSYWRLLRARRVETSTMKLGIQALKQRNGINPAPNSKDDDALAVFFTDDHDNMRNQERYHGTMNAPTSEPSKRSAKSKTTACEKSGALRRTEAKMASFRRSSHVTKPEP
jgi:hypothetical protein